MIWNGRLEQLLGLKEVYICDAKPEQTAEDKKKLVGKAGAEILKRVVKDGDTVGFAWGTTMAGMIGEFHGVKKRSASFVPLVGGPGAMDTKYHVNSIVYSIAGDFGGTPYFIDAAAVVEKRNEGGNRQVPLFQKNRKAVERPYCGSRRNRGAA